MSQLERQSTEPVGERKQLSITWVDLSMLFVATVWGINFAVVKQTLLEIQPMALASTRFVLSSIFIVLFLKARGEHLRFRQEDIWRILLMGIIGITISQTFMVNGINRSTAGNASLLVATNPIFVTLFSVLLNVEEISLAGGIGVGVSFVGVAIIIGASPGGLTLSNATLVGNLLMLASSVSWAVYTLLAQSLSRRYSPLKVTTLAILAGTPCLILVSAQSLWSQRWLEVSLQGWLGVFYSFMFAGVIAFVLWNVSVHEAGNTRTAIFSNLVPVVAVMVSWIFLGETLRSWQIAGAAVTLIGVTMARMSPRRLLTG